MWNRFAERITSGQSRPYAAIRCSTSELPKRFTLQEVGQERAWTGQRLCNFRYVFRTGLWDASSWQFEAAVSQLWQTSLPKAALTSVALHCHHLKPYSKAVKPLTKTSHCTLKNPVHQSSFSLQLCASWPPFNDLCWLVSTIHFTVEPSSFK